MIKRNGKNSDFAAKQLTHEYSVCFYVGNIANIASMWNENCEAPKDTQKKFKTK